MEVLAALGLAGSAGKELFNYNRENFKFDQDQRIERETLRLEMQVKRFELFREDVRDLVELTVDRMDVYHLVGALFLQFCVVLFCEGRVQASAPPFLLSLFLLSNACAFIYLLLAVWLSMHASIASHSFGVRLLTRFVRLPIPSMKQMNNLTSHLKDYEKQGVANLLRMPFLHSEKNSWYEETDDGSKESTRKPSFEKSDGKQQSKEPPSPAKPPPPPELLESLANRKGHKYKSAVNRDNPNAEGLPQAAVAVSPLVPTQLGRSSSDETSGSSGSSAPTSARQPPAATVDSPTGAARMASGLLPEDAENPFGGDDLLSGRKGALPERHVQLFRQLQSKWQCYDAYCRVCMGLGVNMILQALSYYSICHTLVENRSPSTGYGMVVLFQCTTVALAVLDLAGLKRREIVAIQIVGIIPCFFTAWGVARGERNENGVLNPLQEYNLSPLAFLAQVVWLELWIRVAAPSNDKAKLPRRFRQVLFLDVFGDAVGWDPTMAEDEEIPEDRLDRPIFDNAIAAADDEQEAQAEEETLNISARDAAAQLSLAQWAMRRWISVPEVIFSKQQSQELNRFRQQLNNWGATIKGELDRRRALAGGPAEFPFVFEPQLRHLNNVTETERATDPFAGCLVGPFEHDGGYQTLMYHYDVENTKYLWQDDPSKLCPGALLLTLEAVGSVLDDLERDARHLLELRIMTDLKAETRRQKAANRAAQTSRLQSIQEALPPVINSVRDNIRDRNPMSLKASFPNLVSLFRKVRAQSPDDVHESIELLQRNRGASSSSSPTFPAAIPMGRQTSPLARNASIGGTDPTLVAMAGEHAAHFVPERLPWQVLKGLTRVLQLCWAYSGLMAFLKETRVYQVDFQQHPAHERRLLCPANQWAFERLDVEWPHGSFFRPQSIFCDAVDENRLILGSPFALYSTHVSSFRKMQPSEIDRSRMPPSTLLLCYPETSARAPTEEHPLMSSCMLASPTQNAISFWPVGSSHWSSNTTTLGIEGAPWLQLAGGIVRCKDIEMLLASEDSSSTWCLMLVGWDGEMLPIAVVPLPADGLLPSVGTIIRPSLDAPILGGEMPEPEKKDRRVVAMHLETQRGRLWAVKANGELELWDLLHSQSLGSSKLQLPPGAGTFRTAALCESPQSKRLFVVGRSDSAGPILFSTQLTEAHYRGNAEKASSKLLRQIV